jgi:hypothetical protein
MIDQEPLDCKKRYREHLSLFWILSMDREIKKALKSGIIIHHKIFCGLTKNTRFR